MSNLDILSMSVRSLIKRKLRTFLTVLGVVIGTMAIVLMVSLGMAVNKKYDDQIKSLGDVTTITVYNNSYYGGGYAVAAAGGGGVAAQQKKPLVLDDEAIASFSKLPGVEIATPFIQYYMAIKSGKYVMPWCTLIGIYPEAMPALGYKAAEGRLLEPGDKYNVVFGAKAELQFFQNKPNVGWSDRPQLDMQGEKVDTLVNVLYDNMQASYSSAFIYNTDPETNGGIAPPKPFKTQGVGVLEARNDWQTDNAIFMDIKYVRQMQADERKYNQSASQQYGYYSAYQNQTPQGYDTVKVKCKDLKTVKKVKQDIIDMGFFASIPTEYLDSMQSTAASLQLLLIAIGAVSVIVAAIGIANTMLMSIYERTKEIGVMKVVGASLGDIRKMFLLESAVIGLIGGIFGVGLSYLVSFGLNKSQMSFFAALTQGLGDGGAISVITPALCGLALLFATMVGLISGYFPARRAMNLSAIAAIRTE